MRTLFHITTLKDWENAQRLGRYHAASLKTEGFIHFSRPQQVMKVAHARFRGQRDLMLLQIQEEALKSPVKYEDADGDKFPHLYEPLNLEAVIAAHSFHEGPEGFLWPGGFALKDDTLIRYGLSGDEAEIANVHTIAWQQSYKGLVPDEILSRRPLDFRARMQRWRMTVEGREQMKVVVAESRDHGIVGFCAFQSGRAEAFHGFGEICAIYCLNEYKGKGVGAALFRAGIAGLRAQGFNSLYLETLKGGPACEFYRHMGGVWDGREVTVQIGKPLLQHVYVWKDLTRA